MRTISSGKDAVLGAPAGYSAHVRVQVDDGSGTWQDLTDLEGWDWLLGASISEDVDSPMMQADVTLRREIEELSLAHLRTTSKPNVGGTVLDLARQIKVETATMPNGLEPVSGDWENQFEGYIEDINWGGASPVISLRCLDLGQRLMRTFIETVQVYGSSGSGTAVETAMQNILDDNLGAGVVTLHTPTSPGWAITEYKQQREPVLTALRKLAAQIGWDVKYRWDSGTSQWRLTLYGPTRTSPTVDRTFTSDQYWDIKKASISAQDIRNKVQVVFNDSNNDDVRTTYEANDSTSISKYGTRYMAVAEGAASNIDTSAEAQTMADAILDDLKDPTMDHVCVQPFFFAAQLGDYYRYKANGVHYDSDQDLAVVAITHEFPADGDAVTVIETRGKPSAGKYRWLEMSGGPGVAPTPDTDKDAAPTISGDGVVAGIEVEFDDPRTLDPPVNDWAYTEVYADTSTISTPTLGERPSASLLKAKGRQTRFEILGLTPGETYYVRCLHIDESGNIGAISNEISKATQRVGPYHENNEGHVRGEAGPPNFDFNIFTLGDDTPPDFWSVGSNAGDSWGSSGSWYYSTSNTLTGTRSLHARAQTVPASGSDVYEFESDYFVVDPRSGDAFFKGVFQHYFSATENNVVLSVYLDQYDKNKSLLGSELVGSDQAASGWRKETGFDQLDSSTKFLRLRIKKELFSAASADVDIYIDYVQVLPVFVSTLVFSGTTTASTGWRQVPLNRDGASAGGHDQGNNFDTGSGDWEYVVPEDGLYSITAAISAAAADLASGEVLRGQIYKNGSAWSPIAEHESSGTGDDHSVLMAMSNASLSKGDRIQLYLYFSDNVAPDRDNTFMQISQVHVE